MSHSTHSLETRFGGELNESSVSSIAKNRLLAALPQCDWFHIQGFFDKVELRFGQVLLERGERIRRIYWPTTAVVSTVVVLEDGRTPEVVVMIGRMGFVGIEALFGAERALNRRVVQISGAALALPYEIFNQIEKQIPALRQMLDWYAQAYLSQVFQAAACSSLHSAEQRMARFLLTLQDASGKEKIPITQESLAGCLGISRVAAGKVARTFQHKHSIDYSRGFLTIINRNMLQEVSCECYRVIRAEYDEFVRRGLRQVPGMSPLG